MSLIPPEKVGKLLAALHAKAKESPDQRFYSLYDKVYRDDILRHAYDRCRANGGAPGVDGQDVRGRGVARAWSGGWRNWRKNCGIETYRPQPVRRVMIPKADGKVRPLGIPTVRDRVVQTAAALLLGAILEADLAAEQYAYRPDRSALDAVARVRDLLRAGYTEVVDADLSGYFDSIPHAELMKSTARRVSDGSFLASDQNVAGDGGGRDRREGEPPENDPQQGRRERDAARRADLAAAGESVHATIRPGVDEKQGDA